MRHRGRSDTEEAHGAGRESAAAGKVADVRAGDDHLACILVSRIGRLGDDADVIAAVRGRVVHGVRTEGWPGHAQHLTRAADASPRTITPPPTSSHAVSKTGSSVQCASIPMKARRARGRVGSEGREGEGAI